MNKNWEYWVSRSPSWLEIVSLGKRGWEMCGIMDNSFYFKREIKNGITENT